MNDDIFQEEESSELPHFQPIEEVVDTSLLVRQNEEPITLPHELVVKLRSEQAFLND